MTPGGARPVTPASGKDEPGRRLPGFWPRSIQAQMLASVVLLEALSILVFAAFIFHEQTQQVYARAHQRLAHQATSLALQCREALVEQRPDLAGLSVKMMGEAPSVAVAKMTDAAGNIRYVSRERADSRSLDAAERAQIARMSGDDAGVLSLGGDRWEGVKAIRAGGQLLGFAWVETDRGWDHEELNEILRGTSAFGVVWIAASAVLVLLIGRSISRPLAVLHRGTRDLMSLPESEGRFPLPVMVHNEIGDLIETFNRMVASLEEQRAGLDETLSLLDSMLANAPIGLAFFDRECRFVRVNEVFAGMTGIALSSHLGRRLTELLEQPIAQQLEQAARRVFANGEPIGNLEFNAAPAGESGGRGRSSTWLASAYPVRAADGDIRSVGVFMLDASERKRNEEALRKTEKLAATGRLAASIAHEINNPLEAITNLLFLLRNYCGLENPALNYVEMAEHEARRIAQITQQTLRFYRQSTLPARVKITEVLDSVLALYPSRIHSLNLEVERRYDPKLELFCYAGELRQVFANLVANAIDASSSGGRLIVRAHRSHNWKDPRESGVRFVVADTGAGMEPATRARIFEAFFTTKEATGTGLGLWVSHEIVQKHRGLTYVRSRTAAGGRGSGTVFQIFIPDDPNLGRPAA